MDELKTLSKFSRTVAGLQGGNNLSTKPTTLEHTSEIGEQETYTVQTIRHEYKVMVTNRKTGERVVQTRTGDSIILKTSEGPDKTVWLVLPPKVTDAIANHRTALGKRSRTLASKNAMRERMANGYIPNFGK